MSLTIHNLPQGTPEWHALRAGLLTASVVGKLITPALKVANNLTSRELTTRLALETLYGPDPIQYQTPDMRRGTLLEPYARQAYETFTGQLVDQTGIMILETDAYRLGYSPDGLVNDDGLLEIKTRTRRVHIETIMTGTPPAENMAQLQTGLHVSGRAWIDYVSYCPGLPLFVCRVEPDPAWREVIENAATAYTTAAASLLDTWHQLTNDLPATSVEPLEMIA